MADDYYQLLGVNAEADVAAVRAAYRARIGKGGSPAPALSPEERAAVDLAFAVLSNPSRRAKYDENLSAAASAPPPVEPPPAPEPPAPEPAAPEAAAPEALAPETPDPVAPQAAPDPAPQAEPQAEPAPDTDLTDYFSTRPAPASGPGPLRIAAIVAGVLAVLVIAFIAARPRGTPDTVDAAAAPAVAAPAIPPGAVAQPAGRFIEWDEAKDPAQVTYFIDGLVVAVSARDTGNGRVPVLRVTSPDGATLEALGQPGLAQASLRLGVGRLDPSGSGSQVIFTSFSGGAHCCTKVTVLDRLAGGWTAVDLGSWDGEALGDFPTDLDGDGAADLLLSDNSFLYTFASYAGSWEPPLVKSVRNGQVVDISAEPQLRPTFEETLQKARPRCREGDNGACAAFLAAAARLGQADQLWPEMLQGYNRHDDWTLPVGCRSAPAAGESCPQEDQVVFATFPEALRWFLGVQSYMPAASLPPPPSATGPSFDCSKVTSDNLRLICADPDLSAADRELARLYGRALLLVADPEELRNAEREFLRTRNNAPYDKGLLLSLYGHRVGELKLALTVADRSLTARIQAEAVKNARLEAPHTSLQGSKRSLVRVRP